MEFVKKMQVKNRENAFLVLKTEYVKKITIKNEGFEWEKFILLKNQQENDVKTFKI